MFPWTHAAFGYLLFVVVARLYDREVSRAELIAVIMATQLPDLVDKPLAWWFSVLPSGRSLAHALPVVIPLLSLVFVVSWARAHPEVGLAFALGYVSHLVGDTYAAVYHWRPESLSFIFWPFLPAYPSQGYAGFFDFFAQVDITPRLAMFFAMAAIGGVVFFSHFRQAPWWATPQTN